MKKLLTELAKLNLPKDQFVVYGSGPMGIRGIRKIKDLDLVVSKGLWKKLAEKYPSEVGNKLRINLGKIEILDKPVVGTVESLIKEADIIGGIRYVKLETLIKLKRKMGREKDFRDIKLIKNYLAKTKRLA